MLSRSRRANLRASAAIWAVCWLLPKAVWADNSTVTLTPAKGPVAQVLVTAKRPKSYTTTLSATATKTDTPLLATPVNVQTVTPQIMIDQNVTSLDQALVNVSGVVSDEQYGNQENITIRGFNTNSTVFVDGFRLVDHDGMGTFTLSDADSIEVMKGPAAVLYGEAEPGGMVNILTKQPDAMPHYGFSQSFGNEGTYRTTLGATGPLDQARNWTYRLDGSFDTEGSFRPGVWNQNTVLTGTLNWQPDDDWQLQLRGKFRYNPSTMDNGQVVPYSNGKIILLPPNVNLYDPALELNYTTTSQFYSLISRRFDDHWQLTFKTIVNDETGGGAAMDSDGFSPPGSPGNVGANWNLIRSLYPSRSAESTRAASLDLTGHLQTWGLDHTILVGGDASDLNRTDWISADNNQSYIAVFNPVQPGVPYPSVTPDNFYDDDNQTYDEGLHVQDQVKLPDHIDLLAGFRFQHWLARGWYDSYGAQTVSQGYAGRFENGVYSKGAITPRFGLVWEATPSLSLFAEYADNFYPNYGRDRQNTVLPAEGSQDREIGVKSQWFDQKLEADLDLYDLIQTNDPTHDPIHLDPNTGQYDYQLAIGEVRSRGAELDIKGDLTPNWKMILTYSFDDARVLKSNDTLATDNAFLPGFRMPGAPENMASLWTSYDFAHSDDKIWTIGAGAVGQGNSLDAQNLLKSPDFGYFNAMLRYAFDWRGAKLSAQLNLDNITNNFYWQNSSYDYLGYGNMAGVTYGNPRKITLSLRADY